MLKIQFKSNSLVTKYQTLINEINRLESNLKLLSDSDLRVKSYNLKKQYCDTENLNSFDIIIEFESITKIFFLSDSN
jgi:preprotein translocase subunit SecA